MKKWTAAVLPLLLLTFCVPHAFAATSSGAIDMHGAKTYVGAVSDWGKTWDSDNFEEVTEDDVSWDEDGNLKVVSGTVNNITVTSDSCTLTVEGGTMDDIDCAGDVVIEDGTIDDITCDGDVVIKDGDIKNVYAGGDITIKGGDIRHDVESEGELTLSGTVKIGGNITAEEITISSGADVTITGTITAGDYIYLNDCTLKVEAICGKDTDTTLTIDDYTDTLPALEDLGTIIVTEDTTATADQKIEAEKLSIQEDAEFSTSSSLKLDYLVGPGTLYFHSGRLTVYDGIDDKPLLIFSNHVSKGDTAFYADSDSVSEDDVRLYDYGLEVKEDSGIEDKFVLTKSITEGITLSNQTVSLSSGESATIKAYVDPDFSKFAEGTEIIWELYGDSEAFSKSVSSSGLSCTVSVPSSVTGMYKATLICYLVDSHGDRLEDYKSDSCVLTTGYSDTSVNDSTNSSANGITLDTSTVSILIGDQYWVLARTNDSTAPHSMSYNSSIATVGAGKAVKDSSGNPAWIYPVTGVGKGQVTIDIGGAKMIANVSTGITVDTSSYTMAPGGIYTIGVRTKGVAANSIWAFPDNSCVTVQLAGKSGNMLLYRVVGQKAGTANVTFSIAGGESVHTAITVQNGAKAGGVSARLVALA
ncbi:MAG: Carbohydrate-binding domain-containing protein [Clostridium sp.]